jgi:NADH-quinone oxidoreductase subunit M
MPLELKLVVAHLLIAALAHALFGLSHAPSARAIACLVLAFLALEFCQLSHYRPFVLAAAWSSAVLLALTASSARQSSPFEGNLLLIILCSGFGLLCADSLFSAVFCFELMTAGALSLLKMHSKYDRSAEALFEMYVWAMLGSSCLVLSLVLVAFCPTLSVAEPLAAVGLILAAVGFMIKIPMWPFSSWLLKAHVEASTEFSIFLSGFLVKFGVVGLVKVGGFFASGWFSPFVLFLSLAGLADASLRLVAQVDLKRIVAALTIIETNWMSLCLSTGSEQQQQLGMALVLIHALTTTLEFFLVEMLYRRFGSRSIYRISGVGNSLPVLGAAAWFSCLTVIGLPGTSVFFAKMSFFVSALSFNLLVTLFTAPLFLLLIPIAIIRTFSTILGGSAPVAAAAGSDLSVAEVLMVGSCATFSTILGVFPALLF